MTSRVLDIVARELRARDEGFYTLGSSGHEGNALVGHYTRSTDPAFLHYRSGAFMMERARGEPGASPIFNSCLSFVASVEDPVASGRHKVWGSRALWVPPQTSTIGSHLPKAVGAALAFERRKRLLKETSATPWPALPESPAGSSMGPLADPAELPDDALFLCSFGDASLNHSTSQGAINAAGWAAYQQLPLPLLFVCEDNGIGISVKSPEGWVRASMASRPGIGYHYADGLDLVNGAAAVQRAVEDCRRRRRPTFLHLGVVRLLGHAGSDHEQGYRSLESMEAAEARDPVLHNARRAVELGLIAPREVLERYDGLLEQARAAGREAETRPRHESPATIMEPLALKPGPDKLPLAAPQTRVESWGGADKLPEARGPRPLARLIGDALADLFLADPSTILFGEDVAKKGGVYTVTRGLAERFGKGRVFNTLLDEQAILGLAIGAGHMGLLPIPEIQYLAYLHNALDQIRGEACSMRFFSNDQFRNPMVVRIASYAYQRGFGGHFHNDNSIAALRDIPGLVIASPARGADAVGMLRTCAGLAREQGAVVAFLEPIARYFSQDLIEKDDRAWLDCYPEPEHSVPLGQPRFYGDDEAALLIVSYGNGVFLSLQAQSDLAAQGLAAQVMDLRWLAPLPAEAMATAAKGRKVLFVDEGRRSGGVSEALYTALCEQDGGDPGEWRRVVGDDTYIPLGRAWAHVLPSRESIVAAALELCR